MLRLVYRGVLRLHPARFRERFGEEMLWIFDEATDGLARTRFVADGVVSLLRQWGLRPHRREESTPEPVSGGLPIFQTVSTFRPRSDALAHGAVLTLALFLTACFAVRYSENHESFLPFHMNRGEGQSPTATSGGALASLPLGSPTQTNRVLKVGDSSASLRMSFTILPVEGLSKAGRVSKPPASSAGAKPAKGSERAEPYTAQLPHPSGKYGVARIGYDWTDNTRHEPQADNPGSRREIAVYVWYPTQPSSGQSRRAEYLPHAEAIAKKTGNQIEQEWGNAWPRIFSGQVHTDTYEQARIAPGSQAFPILIFSPGFRMSSSAYTALIEEAVSQGYVVASIEPTYDAPAVAFPDGRVITFRPERVPGADPVPAGETWDQFLGRLRAFNEPHVETGAADIRFVIDQLTAIEKHELGTAPFAGRIDLLNVGAWGHSIGGKAAARACQLDSRIKACLDADGGAVEQYSAFHQGANLPAAPFLWIDVYHESASDAQLAIHGISRSDWEKFHEGRVRAAREILQSWPGGSYRLSIKSPGTNHYTFTDWPLLDAQSEKDFDDSVEALKPIESYSVAFFDKYLKHRANTLLDGGETVSAGVTLEKYGPPREGQRTNSSYKFR